MKDRRIKIRRDYGTDDSVLQYSFFGKDHNGFTRRLLNS